MLDSFLEVMPLCETQPLPLKSNENIRCGNALRMDWSDVLPAAECDYIMGNPPFIGYSNQSSEQKREMLDIWKGKDGKPIKQAGKIDYVSAWYYKAASYTTNHKTKCAFVSTNSICQGDQVQPIWQTLGQLFGTTIDFAWKPFIWNSEAREQAHVHVIIVGFSSGNNEKRVLFDKDGAKTVENINGYLSAAPNTFVTKSKKPICNAPIMTTGNRPADGGHLIIEDSEYSEFIAKEPNAAKFIRPLLGSREFINSEKRWCLWLKDADCSEIDDLPLVQERVRLCKEDRLNAPDAGRQRLAKTPTLFRETKSSRHSYLVIPKVSSERRVYIPIGYVSKETICTDLLFIVLDGGLYEFGILTSQFHNAWMRSVAGRLKSDYRYSQDIVYNNFVWPGAVALNAPCAAALNGPGAVAPKDNASTETKGGAEECDAKSKTKDNAPAFSIDTETPVEELVSPQTRRSIEEQAQAVLDARAVHAGKTLAELYDPQKMPANLQAAHKALDAAVEAAYGVDFNGNEDKIVAHLFELYSSLTENQ